MENQKSMVGQGHEEKAHQEVEAADSVTAAGSSGTVRTGGGHCQSPVDEPHGSRMLT